MLVKGAPVVVMNTLPSSGSIKYLYLSRKCQAIIDKMKSCPVCGVSFFSYRYFYIILFLWSRTHWGQDKMADILQMIFTNALCFKKIIVFWFKFHLSLLVQIMAWCWSGNKPLSEPMMSQFTDSSVEAETKWQPFSRRHFQIHFLARKFIYFD